MIQSICKMSNKYIKYWWVTFFKKWKINFIFLNVLKSYPIYPIHGNSITCTQIFTILWQTRLEFEKNSDWEEKIRIDQLFHWLSKQNTGIMGTKVDNSADVINTNTYITTIYIKDIWGQKKIILNLVSQIKNFKIYYDR